MKHCVCVRVCVEEPVLCSALSSSSIHSPFTWLMTWLTPVSSLRWSHSRHTLTDEHRWCLGACVCVCMGLCAHHLSCLFWQQLNSLSPGYKILTTAVGWKPHVREELWIYISNQEKIRNGTRNADILEISAFQLTAGKCFMQVELCTHILITAALCANPWCQTPG